MTARPLWPAVAAARPRPPLLQRRLDDAENEVRTQAQEVEQLQQLLSEAQRHADAARGAARGVKRG